LFYFLTLIHGFHPWLLIFNPCGVGIAKPEGGVFIFVSAKPEGGVFIFVSAKPEGGVFIFVSANPEGVECE
jgi:hypothetical protein